MASVSLLGVSMLDALRHDLTFATRSLLRARGATAVAVASLAIGIAANATVFSLLQAVEFPSLIYPRASRVVFLESRNQVRNLAEMSVSAPDALDIAAATHSLERTSLTADQTSILRDGPARRVSGRRVTAAFFDVMGVSPSIGRVLAPHDEPGVIVLGDRLWRREFATDPSVIGRTVHLDGGVVTVVGVMPPRFDADADFWTPLTSPGRFARDDRQFTMFARLSDATSFADAEREIGTISERLATAYSATNRDWSTYPVQITRMHGRDARGVFALLQGAVGFVLLIACANIANILLARGTRRRHEMAVRVSLGASRGRLLSQLLTESLLLSLTGGAIGVMFSMWGIRFARVLGGFPDFIDPQLNPLVLAFTVSLTMLTGLACGIVPALRASGVAPEFVLRAEDGRASGSTRGRLRAALVALQVASAIVLATCGTLMLRTFANRTHVDLGFDPRLALRADLLLPPDRYSDADAIRRVVDTVLDRLNHQPDIIAASASSWALPTAPGGQRQFTLPGERDAPLAASVRRAVEAVSPAYFDAMAAPLRLGRRFTAADRSGAGVAIVNEELAARLWPNRNPVGERLRLGAAGEAAPVVTVIGVVSTIRRSAMHDVPVARAYVPFAAYPNASVSLIVRARADAGAATHELQATVQQSDPSILVEGVRTMEADLAQFVAPIRLITTLLAAFGVAGLLLAAMGVFGTTNYVVSVREREMAVRSALGADRRAIVRLVFEGAFKMVAVGVAAGLIVAFAATRLLASFLYGVGPTDPLTFVTVAAVLVAVSLAACYRPARLAATVDPMSILRQ